MSHEIRTPMNAILGYSQILRRNREATADQRQALETIEQSGRHLLSMINDILDLSKIEAGRMELHPVDFDLFGLVEDVAAMFSIRCREKRLAWKLECFMPDGDHESEEQWRAEPVPLVPKHFSTANTAAHFRRAVWVKGDEGKLRQVLINLLGNAVKFTERGQVTLRVGPSPTSAPEPGDEVHASGRSLAIHFEVVDTGVGIAPELQARLFQPFQQGREGQVRGGAGLGLALSRRHVELLGGELRVESRLGEGSRFHFTISLARGEGGSKAECPRTFGLNCRLKQGSQVNALVVDDNPQNREVLSRMLRDIGCHVRLADSGEQALARIAEAVPDVVFLDIRMPDMDGTETARRIRQRWGPDRPRLVAISASVLLHEQRGFLEAGFAEFLGKPFRFERICECLVKVLSAEFETSVMPEDDRPALTQADWAALGLSAEDRQRLIAAAENHSSTELKAVIRELAEASPNGARLAAVLQPFVNEFNLDRILEIVRRIQSP
jgi:CheY-like chemotaxis protein